MFEDLEDEDIDVSPDSPDRAIVYAIWQKSESAALTAEEAWAILHERYPDDARFLLLNAYHELAESVPSEPGYLVTKIDRIVSGAPEAVHVHVRELLAYGGAVLGKATGDDAKRIATMRTRVGAEGEAPTKRDERAALKLRRFEREVLKELHDRTEGGKPLGTRAPSPTTLPPPPVNALEEALADASRTRKKYAATDKFAKGELVEHPKFGVGVVTALEPGRVTILFESGSRKLVSA